MVSCVSVSGPSLVFALANVITRLLCFIFGHAEHVVKKYLPSKLLLTAFPMVPKLSRIRLIDWEGSICTQTLWRILC